MEISELIEQFSTSREKQIKAIFSTLFIADNRLQTVFDKEDSNISLKQFMLLTMVRRSEKQLTFTQLGRLLGCSRQNIKKIAALLEQKGFVEIGQSTSDTRAAVICPTEKLESYFDHVSELHQKKLGLLFRDYSDGEVELLFRLLMKLYKGIEGLEEEI